MLGGNHIIPFHWETHMTVWSSCLTGPRPRTGAAHLAALLGALLLLGACGAHDRLADYRPVVDSYRTDMAAYDGDLRQCVTVAQRAEAEYQRKSREQREANAMTGLLVGVVMGAVIGSVDADAGDGAIIGGTFGLLEGGLADTEYDPHKSPRMIVDRCMKNRGYEILSDPGAGG